MRNNQKGFICDLTIAGWLVVLFVIAFVLTLFMTVNEEWDADAEQLKNVNEVVALAQKQPFKNEFNTAIKPYIEDNRISKAEAKEILKKYETIQLKSNVVSIKK